MQRAIAAVPGYFLTFAIIQRLPVSLLGRGDQLSQGPAHLGADGIANLCLITVFDNPQHQYGYSSQSIQQADSFRIAE